MARQPKVPPRLALFDRLLQGDSIETDRNAERALRELRESVRRDLEILFNTRPRHLPFDPRLEELQQSILYFGLSELQGQHLATAAQQAQFQNYLQAVIARFEPRFRDLSVELTTAQDPLDRILRFQIHAVLETESVSEPVTYDTMIDPVTGSLVIRES
jgi:type VI secretion system protein ImpF